MPTLKDLGIELQSFAPIPNSVIVGTVSFGEMDIETFQQVFQVVKAAFDEQKTNNSVVFIPDNISLQRFSKEGLYLIRDNIDSIIKGCEN